MSVAQEWLLPEVTATAALRAHMDGESTKTGEKFRTISRLLFEDRGSDRTTRTSHADSSCRTTGGIMNTTPTAVITSRRPSHMAQARLMGLIAFVAIFSTSCTLSDVSALLSILRLFGIL